MNILRRAAGFARHELFKQSLVALLSLTVLFATWPQTLWAYQDPQTPAPPAQATAQGGQAPAQAPPYTPQTPAQLQQLVAPIALYPDSLVAQILAASTFPEQVVEADRWVQAHPDLKGDALGKAVDQQPWDPSVKALTAFPTVLGNMDKNLSWTSSLGDAYYNQQQDVMDAVQVMRARKAEDAGNLKTTPQARRLPRKARLSSFNRPIPMLFTFPHITRGLFTGDQFIRGPDGTPTLASGLAGRTSRSDLDLELAGSAASGGVGGIGDSIGMAGIQSTAAAGTTPRVERSTTETISTVQDADLTATADTGPTAATEPTAVEFTTTREQSLNHSTEITRLREDTRNPTANRTEIARLREDMRNPTADRATFTRERLAGTTVADRSGVFPRVATPASVAEASTEAAGVVAFMAEAAVVVADANRGYVILVSS